jgi:UTP:GlnB (protein PII) uridylyltransferase
VAFVGTVMHSQKHAKGDCGLRCDHAVRVLDECCVTCTQNSITVKACC